MPHELSCPWLIQQQPPLQESFWPAWLALKKAHPVQFMIAQALVESGKHTNRYDLAREAVLIATAVTQEIARSVENA